MNVETYHDKAIFCLCVDDFGVYYQFKEDANHLLHILETQYSYTVDWIDFFL